MKKKIMRQPWFYATLSATVLIIVGAFYYQANREPGYFDDFARCLKTNGANFYGASWCSHCQDQKELFGQSAKYLPYVECSTPNGGINALCKRANITGYPTWVLSDGSQLSGTQSLETLAEKTACQLPSANQK